MGCSPGGAQRNFDSFGQVLGPMTQTQRDILCDPQTSGGGGLLVSVNAARSGRIYAAYSKEWATTGCNWNIICGYVIRRLSYITLVTSPKSVAVEITAGFPNKKAPL